MCFLADVVLQFVQQQQLLSANETEIVTVCAMLSGPIERAVLAEITGQDDSATGSLLAYTGTFKCTFSPYTVSNDYSITTGELEFQASNDPMVCVDAATIEQDSVLESTEIFFLLLGTSDESVTIHPNLSQITVEINDINSKLMERSEFLQTLRKYSNCSCSDGISG